MEFRTRHMAIVLYAAIASLAMVIKPEIITGLQDIILLLAPLGAMFAWDKIKEGSLLKKNA